MKSINHKFIFFGILFLLTTLTSEAQEDTISNKFSLKSLSFTPTSVFWSQPDGSNSNSYFAGYALIADVTFNYRKNLLSFSPSAGFEILGSNKYVQLNVLYGREFSLSKRLFLEAHAGVGYLYLEDNYDGTFFETSFEKPFRSTIGFPLMGKFRFMTGKRFSVGFLFQTNINPEFPIYSGGISLQWNLWDVYK